MGFSTQGGQVVDHPRLVRRLGFMRLDTYGAPMGFAADQPSIGI